MKYTLLLLFVVALFQGCDLNEKDDSKIIAQNIIEDYLVTIKESISEEAISLDYMKPASDLETLSGIHSTADGNSIGKMPPSSSELCDWTLWYLENKSKLNYDEEKNEIYLD